MRVCDVCKQPYHVEASLFNQAKGEADWSADLCEQHSQRLKTLFEALKNELYATKH